MDPRKQMLTYIKASFPIIHILSDEYDRVYETMVGVINDLNVNILPKANVERWIADLGISLGKWDCINGIVLQDETILQDTVDLEDALRYILNEVRYPLVTVFENTHRFLDSHMAPIFIQLMIELARARYAHKHVVIIGSDPLLPELRPYAVTVNFPLPSKKDIEGIIKDFVKNNLEKVKVNSHAISNICVGMNALEIESALCVSAVSKKGHLDKSILYHEKAKAVQKTGLLELMEVGETLDDVGGLDHLKEWFRLVAKAFKNPTKAEKYHLPNMKGTLITGISGTGKSLCAKAIADLFEVPLIRFDIGRVFGSLVGETERNTREAFKMIDAVSPCVVLIDEVEKALAGLEGSGSTDSGVTARFIGSFLYYMQEKKSQSFFVCTANDISKLPPELTRKGRFDEIWYVNLPSIEDTKNIIKIHLRKVGRDPKNFKIPTLAKHMHQFTGAEIENCVKQAMYNAFFEDREFVGKDIIQAAKETVPIVKTRKEEIQRLEKWARDRARFASNNKQYEKIEGKGWIQT